MDKIRSSTNNPPTQPGVGVRQQPPNPCGAPFPVHAPTREPRRGKTKERRMGGGRRRNAIRMPNLLPNRSISPPPAAGSKTTSPLPEGESTRPFAQPRPPASSTKHRPPQPPPVFQAPQRKSPGAVRPATLKWPWTITSRSGGLSAWRSEEEARGASRSRSLSPSSSGGFSLTAASVPVPWWPPALAARHGRGGRGGWRRPGRTETKPPVQAAAAAAGYCCG